MPRNIPTTSWGDRTLPTTTWATGRDTDYVTWNEAIYSWDVSEPDTWDTGGIQTEWVTPRKGFYVEAIGGLNVEDLLGDDVTSLSGDGTNIIDTVWQ